MKPILPGVRRPLAPWALLAAVCSACVAPRAWLIERNEAGGVIGYKKGNMDVWGEEEQQERLLTQAIDDEARGICGSARYRIVRERRQEREYTYYTQQAVRTESKSDVSLNSETDYSYRRPRLQTKTTGTVDTRSTTYVPVQQTGIEVWWEATISCSGFTGSLPPTWNSSERSTTPVRRPSQSAQRAPVEASSRCTEADLVEMRAAGLSESAITSACSP